MTPGGNHDDAHDDAMQNLWWEGVRYWYNDQDYEGAMNAWTRALFLHVKWQFDHTGEFDEIQLKDYDEWVTDDVNEEDDLRLLALSMQSNDEVDDAAPTYSDRRELRVSLSPLWLFLAGCWLDARGYAMARRCLRVCLRECWHLIRKRRGVRRGSQDVLHETVRRALVEYAASYEEQNPARSVLGSRIVLLARRNFPDHSVSYHALPWTVPDQRPGYLHPSLPSQPFYAGDDRPSWCDDLEAHYSAIRNEFEQLYLSSRSWPRVGQGDHRGGSGKHDGRVVLGGDWREIVLFGTGAAKEGVAPHTRQWVRSHLPEAVELASAGGGEVIFSVLQPRTTLLPHCATTNLRLTAHLGLVIPSDASNCRIRVGSRWETWQEGKVLVFDDSFEHEVVNNTDHMRAVLLIRFWHPQLRGRSLALEKALDAKRRDEVQRYNPPLPGLEDGSPVRRRALEMSQCHSCRRSGVSSIRVLDVGAETMRVLDVGGENVQVVCICGRTIVD
jgi:Aspartyl/Asparaginyl beta-hydroxylase